jgi:glucose/arabinose dehydrogenase
MQAGPTGGVGTGGVRAGGAGGAPGSGAGGTADPAGAGGSAGTGGSGGSGGGPAPMSTVCSAPTQNATVGNACKGSAPPAIQLTMVVSGLLAPTFVAQAPGDTSRLYVLEQRGTIRVVMDGALQPEPLLDLRMLSGDNAISTGPGFYTEAGLLGMAFDPNFEQTKRFWLNYNKSGSYDTRIVEYVMSDPDQVDVNSGTDLLTVPQLSFNHQGGMLAFGADGCLYIGMGDGGNENDTQGTGQGTDDMLSVMLRVDVDNYPTAAPGNQTMHIWSTGLRNPWRYSFDRMTGDLYMGDVGQGPSGGVEEINVEPRGVSSRNYGWSPAQGMSGCGAGCTPPALGYPTTGSANSVIGGYVYRGSAMPDMVGRYIWADWTERRIKTFIYSGETDGAPEICDEHDTGVMVPAMVRSFGEDLAGEIYVLAAGSGGIAAGGGSLTAAGTLYKIEPE